MRAWAFGDNLDTDVIAPGRYMKFGIEEIAQHCLESVSPAFAKEVQPGDIVVGGRNFGAGSSREQAPEAIRETQEFSTLCSASSVFMRKRL